MPPAVEPAQPNEGSATARPVEVSTAVLPNEAHTTQLVKAPVTTQLNETSRASISASSNTSPINTLGMKERDSYTHHPSGTTTAGGGHPIPPAPGPNPPSSHPSQEGAMVTSRTPIPTCEPDTGVWRSQPAVSGTDAGSRMTSKAQHGHVNSNDKRCVCYVHPIDVQVVVLHVCSACSHVCNRITAAIVVAEETEAIQYSSTEYLYSYMCSRIPSSSNAALHAHCVTILKLYWHQPITMGYFQLSTH